MHSPMMAPELYLCRHGQTAWNAAGRLQGQADVPLNAFGRSQAQRNGRYLRNVLGERAACFEFLSSPLSRARETMEIIRAELGLSAEGYATDARLIEVHFGDWQGDTLGDIAVSDPAGLRRRKADKWNFRPPGSAAESYEDLAQRVTPVFEALSQPTIVVAHGGVTRSFLHRFGNLDDHAASHFGVAQDRILRNRTAPTGTASIDWV